MPGLNHLFQHAKTGMLTEYSAIEETMSPDVLEKVAAWIFGNGKDRSAKDIIACRREEAKALRSS